jgi:hypothetical protein
LGTHDLAGARKSPRTHLLTGHKDDRSDRDQGTVITRKFTSILIVVGFDPIGLRDLEFVLSRLDNVRGMRSVNVRAVRSFQRPCRGIALSFLLLPQRSQGGLGQIS